MARRASRCFETLANEYFENGYAVVPGFLSDAEVNAMRRECDLLIAKNWDNVLKKYKRGSKYYVNVVDYVFFLNPTAFDDNFNLKKEVEPRNAIRSLGLKFHAVNELFKRIVFGEGSREILKCLHFVKPTVFESIVVHRFAGITAAGLHQGEAFVDNDVKGKSVAFWLAMDESNEANGTFKILPGSHRTVKWRKITGSEQNAYPEVDESQMVTIATEAGDLVLVHGLLVHNVGPNPTTTLRRSFTFSVFDKHFVEWSTNNHIRDDNGTHKFVDFD